MMMVEIVTV